MSTLYVVPAGTDCFVKKPPGGWRRHTTRVAVACARLYLAKDHWYYLVNGAWRIKVVRECVLEERVDDKLETLFAENEAMANDCFWRGKELQTRKT